MTTPPHLLPEVLDPWSEAFAGGDQVADALLETSRLDLPATIPHLALGLAWLGRALEQARMIEALQPIEGPEVE